MAPKRPFGLVDVVFLVAVLAVAAGARVGYLVGVADGGQSSGPVLVQDPAPRPALPPDAEMRGRAQPNELDELVHNLSEHRWFGSLAPFAGAEEKTAHTSPGYPWLLSWLMNVFGPEDLDPAVRWGQCVLGVLTAGLYFLFARRVFQSRLVAILAGLLTALHPFWVVNTASLNDGTLTTFLLALVLYLGSVAGQTGAPVVSLLFGLSAAGLALVRAALLPFSFVAVVWLLWRSRRLPRGWLCAILVVLGFVNGLVPWTVRNVLTFGEPFPLVSSTWLHLWEGNNPRATGGPLTEQQLLEALAEARGVDLELVRAEMANLPQPERYRRLAVHVLREIQKRPGETVYRRLAAACYFFSSSDLAFKTKVSRQEAPQGKEIPGWVKGWADPVLLVTLGFMFLLALFAWRWTYPWREQAAISTLALIWVPLPYILGHAAHLHGPRLPLDGVLLTYAAFVLACLWPSSARLLAKGPQPEEEKAK